ncbi:MAG TPA: efflux RND transporter periplasmic adaptor subunit [Usitatibacter sp.]|nr:efflux RND transporter periplasmic adaptor subunit [Usitatibacter sp.]
MSPSPASTATPAPKAGRRLAKPAIAAIVVLAIAGSIFGLRASQAKKEPAKGPDAARTFEFAPGDLAELKREPLGRQIPVSGTMKPQLQATVRSKVAAEVARVHVQEGQPVAAGAPLITLDAQDLAARLDAQLAAVAEARARLDLARKNQANNKALLEKSFISQNAYDSVANSVQVAEANLKSAEAQAAIARRAVDDAQVRAPFAGIVAKRWVNQGDKVTADMPIAQVVDLARMELEAQVPVSEIPFVQVGQSIAFQVDGFQGRRFAGKIERVNPAADPGSRSIAVFATLPNTDASLKGGMFANGTLATASGSEVDVIPVSAVIEEGGQSFVYVVKGGKVERRSVVLGERNLERGVVTVREGLERGVPVIAVKAEGLKPGAKAVVKSGRAA